MLPKYSANAPVLSASHSPFSSYPPTSGDPSLFLMEPHAEAHSGSRSLIVQKKIVTFP
jgi:hypothetical protein